MAERRRWRFAADFDGVPQRERIVEVEVEPTNGINLTTGDRWTGLHVKARYPLMRDRRWKRANIVGPVAPNEKAAVERAAIELLRGTPDGLSRPGRASP